MPIVTCERCGAQTAKVEKCNYCGKTICYNCIKSQKRVDKTKRYYICKSCWSNLDARKQFKSV